MRKIILIIAAMCIFNCVQAKTIKVKDAELKARTFLNEKSGTPLNLATTLSTGNKADLYVFNKQSKDGYVIVAAEDAVDNIILGYSDSGQFDADNMPENLRWWLGEYQKQINYAREIGYKSSIKQSGRKTSTIVVAPLLGNVVWDQDEPFNNLCPTEGKNHCMTGCVATAMAQIIYYNKWPLKGQGKHSYVWKGQTLTVDYSQSVYNYAKMRPIYEKGKYTEEEANAVAKLMYDCGVSVEMQYGVNSSGAYSEDVADALKKYFDYGASVKYYSRMDYKGKEEEWDGMIRKELDEHRPVYYSGVDPSQGGHAFVCDGYKDDGYFHFNFGWSGSGNGYFITKLLATSVGNFAADQDIVIGIKANNKQKVGNLYYSVTSDNTVSLQNPSDFSEYSGDITIPSTVAIEGKTYSVNEIAAYAFYKTNVTSIHIPASVMNIGPGAMSECNNLKNIAVEWTTPNQVTVLSNAFSNDTYDNATLEVPAGRLSKYIYQSPWFLFRTIIDSAGQKCQYGDWAPFSTGKGTYYYGIVFGGTDECVIRYRDNIQDPDQRQILINNWVYSDLMVYYNKSTDKYTIPKQETNYNYGSYGQVYAADFETYTNREASYDQMSSFNEKKGLFTFCLYYFVNQGYINYGTETFQLDGYPDYYVTVEAKTQTEQSDGTAYQLLGFDWGTDISTVKYALIDKAIDSKYVLNTYIEQMIDGTIPTKKVSEKLKNKVSITLDHAGQYTVIAIGFDANGEYADYGYTTFEFKKTEQWQSVGTAEYTDDIIGPLFEADPVTYYVEIQTHPDHPGIYRMVNPYGETFPYNEDGDWDKSRDWNIDINAEDPDGVYIEQQKTGCDWGYGNMTIMSMGYYSMTAGGQSFDEAKSSGIMGTLKDGVITFPTRGLVVGDDEGLYYSNTNGAFRLDLSNIESPDAIGSVAENRTTTAATYNLSGQAVSNTYKGIVIRDGKKYLRK